MAGPKRSFDDLRVHVCGQSAFWTCSLLRTLRKLLETRAVGIKEASAGLSSAAEGDFTVDLRGHKTNRS